MKKYFQHYIVIWWYYIVISSVSMFHSVMRIYKRGCMCVWFVVHIPSIITKCYSHYTIFIYSDVKGQRESKQQAIQVAAAHARNNA